jgi:hypothetical protein
MLQGNNSIVVAIVSSSCRFALSMTSKFRIREHCTKLHTTGGPGLRCIAILGV